MILVVASVLAAVVSLIVSWAASSMTELIVLLPGFLKLQLSYNPGIAFGIHVPSPWKEIIILAALLAVCVFALRSQPRRITSIAFGLIIGGAIANLLDRLPDGLVTDYVSVGRFPVFNAADSCITVGVLMLLVVEVSLHRRTRT